MEDMAKSGTITLRTPRGSSLEARQRMAKEGVRRLHEWLQHQSVHEGQEELESWVPEVAPKEQRTKAKSWLPVYSGGVIVRWERAMAPEAAAETPATWSEHLLTTTDRWERSIKLGSGGTDPEPNLASAGSGGIDPDPSDADMQTARDASMTSSAASADVAPWDMPSSSAESADVAPSRAKVRKASAPATSSAASADVPPWEMPSGSPASADVAPSRAKVRKPAAYAASGGVDPDVRSQSGAAASDTTSAAPVKHQITLQEAEAIVLLGGSFGLSFRLFFCFDSNFDSNDTHFSFLV